MPTVADLGTAVLLASLGFGALGWLVYAWRTRQRVGESDALPDATEREAAINRRMASMVPQLSGRPRTGKPVETKGHERP